MADNLNNNYLGSRGGGACRTVTHGIDQANPGEYQSELCLTQNLYSPKSRKFGSLVDRNVVRRLIVWLKLVPRPRASRR